MDGNGKYYYKNNDKLLDIIKKIYNMLKVFIILVLLKKGKWIKGKKNENFNLKTPFSNSKSEIILRYENDIQLKNQVFLWDYKLL